MSHDRRCDLVARESGTTPTAAMVQGLLSARQSRLSTAVGHWCARAPSTPVGWSGMYPLLGRCVVASSSWTGRLRRSVRFPHARAQCWAVRGQRLRDGVGGARPAGAGRSRWRPKFLSEVAPRSIEPEFSTAWRSALTLVDRSVADPSSQIRLTVPRWRPTFAITRHRTVAMSNSVEFRRLVMTLSAYGKCARGARPCQADAPRSLRRGALGGERIE